MTKTDFLDDIDTWSRLMDFCDEENCDICEDVYDKDEVDSKIDEDIIEELRYTPWQNIRDNLNNIPEGSEYYYRQDSLDYSALDDIGFDNYKDRVVDWMDENESWDEEDENESWDEEDVTNVEDIVEDLQEEFLEDMIPNEAFSITELISGCAVDIALLQREDKERRVESELEIDEAFSELVPFF